jgi:GNAT superfamily N-acetyltransferase
LPIDPIIEISDHDIPEERALIENALRAYNASSAPPANYLPLHIALKDSAGTVIGGLVGHSSYEWLFIHLLIVPESHRRQGLGRKLMQQAEQVARTRNLTGNLARHLRLSSPPLLRKARLYRLRRTERPPTRHIPILAPEAPRLIPNRP